MGPTELGAPLHPTPHYGMIEKFFPSFYITLLRIYNSTCPAGPVLLLYSATLGVDIMSAAIDYLQQARLGSLGQVVHRPLVPRR